jgi:hypothetical protein
MSDLKVRPPKEKRARGRRAGEKQVPRLRSGMTILGGGARKKAF